MPKKVVRDEPTQDEVRMVVRQLTQRYPTFPAINSGEVATHWGSPTLFSYAQSFLRMLHLHSKMKPMAVAQALAPLDQHHGGGMAATEILLGMMSCQGTALRGLDIGCGLGGPLRLAALRINARIVGIDVTPDMIQTAKMLTRVVGLSKRCEFKVMDATTLNFDDATFDFVVAMAVACNISNREQYDREVIRVLRPGGILGILEPFQGPTEGCILPVPWSRDGDPKSHHIITPEATIASLKALGLQCIGWRDIDDLALKWFQNQQNIPDTAATPDRSKYIPEWPGMMASQIRNIQEGHIAFKCLVFQKRSL